MSHWLDSAIAAVAPQWAARRAQARLALAAATARATALQQLAAAGGLHPESRYFDASRQDRTSKDWGKIDTSADGSILGEMTLANARARAAVVNDWAARGIVSAFRRHVVGIGITPRSAARDPETGEETEAFAAFNKRIDWLYYRWARRPELCDTERRKNIPEIDGLAVSELWTVGQALCVLNFTPRRGQVGLHVQMFEPEQLDGLLTKNDDTGYEIRNGIEIDEAGAAVAYWVHTGKHPAEAYGSSAERIPARRVLHVMRQERVRQTHGWTQLCAALEDIYQLKGYKQAEAVAKRIEACIGLRLRHEQWYSGEGEATMPGLGAAPPTGGSSTDARGNTKARLEPGMILDAGPGRYWDSLAPQRPGAQYEQYTDRQVQQIAAAAGSDSAHVQRNFAKGNFSSQRQGALEHRRETDPVQMNLLVDLWARPRRERFKVLAVLQGLVEAPGFFEDPILMAAYLEDDWQGPPVPWVDPKNQATATDQALRDGLTTLRSQANLLGGDWRELIDQRAREAEYARRRGVSLSWISGAAEAPGETEEEDAAEERDTEEQRDEEELVHA